MTPQEMKAELRTLGARIEAGLGAIFTDGRTPAPLVKLNILLEK